MMAKTRSAAASPNAVAAAAAAAASIAKKPASFYPPRSLSFFPSCFSFSSLVVAVIVTSCVSSWSVSDGASVPITTASSLFSSPSFSPLVSSSPAGFKDDNIIDDKRDNFDGDLLLKSLASSRILMDHPTEADITSSSSSSSSSPSKEIISNLAAAEAAAASSQNRVALTTEQITTAAPATSKITTAPPPPSSSSSITTGSTTLPTKVSSSSSSSSSSIDSSSSSSSSTTAKRMTMMSSSSSSSPLHVARCRATCLDKFHPSSPAKIPTRPKNVEMQETGTRMPIMTTADQVHLSPILRLRRRRRAVGSKGGWSSSGTVAQGNSVKRWSCLQNSPDCLYCWKSCELLEPQDLTSSVGAPVVVPASTSFSPEAARNKLDSAKNSTFGGTFGKSGSSVGESKQSILSCSSNKHCTGGCQVACSFYQRLYSSLGENNEDTFFSTTTDPVVAMKHESIVKIAPGKVTWPPLLSKENSASAPSAVVYVVIQEYPDRKWRQIAQTTETEIDIPTELTSSSSSKLRGVRVLVVGKDGLLSVYNPVKSWALAAAVMAEELKVGQELEERRKSDNNAKTNSSSNNSEPVNRPDSEGSDKSNDDRVAHKKTDAITAIAEAKVEASSTTSPVLDARNDTAAAGAEVTADAAANDHQMVYANGGTFNVITSSNNGTPTPISRTTSVTANDSTRDPSSNKPAAVVVEEKKEPFELRVVSLIHQKSLVIAELKWDEIGGNPNQDYLITWELSGGGLKGHLVTDSTSVTLSLWPDTTYQIQVEKFTQNLDAEGEQEEELQQPGTSDVGSSSLKSLPLTVDTSEASFPMEQPSALLGSSGLRRDVDDDDEDSEDDYENEDVSVVGSGKVSLSLAGGMSGVEAGFAAVQDPTAAAAHKSITGGFLNMTLLLGIAISALLFVLVILTVAAFTWTRMRALSQASLHDGQEEHYHRQDRHHNRASSPSSLDFCSSSPMLTPTKNSRNPYGLLGEESYDRNCGEGGCCYDCDGGDIGGSTSSNVGCYSYGCSEPQPLLYCQEDYSWDECPHHYHHHPKQRTSYSVGFATTAVGATHHHHHLCRNYYNGGTAKDDANGILRCSFETSPQKRKGNESSSVAVISSFSNDLPMPSLVTPGYSTGATPSSSYLPSYYRTGSSNIAYTLLGDSTDLLSSVTKTNMRESGSGFH